uniref:Uncharacterized protein AlNc14C78G5176 n=1 Tax=Albugo laibachii Nc14 TaxID=890382 RepID=F0WEX8_9STRA|nr:conserved hypothetical protein [Albugo laibachii Nc14]|eukprot:CCA19760.1 conserved hypothetical protein [Albugo laibachii Nc14]
MSNSAILIYENHYGVLLFTPLAVLFGWALYAYLENRRRFIILLKIKGRSNAKASRKMSNIGLTTLLTETKSNPSVPVTYMELEGVLTREEAIGITEKVIQDPFFIRLRSIVVRDAKSYVEIPDFDVSKHIFTHRLESETVLEAVEAIRNQPFDDSKPLWEFHLLQDQKDSMEQTSNSVMCMKAHHCLGDGMSSMLLMAKLSDQRKAIEATMAKLQRVQRSAKKKLNLLVIFGRIVDVLVHLSRTIWILLRDLSALCIRSEPQTAFNRPGTGKRRLGSTKNFKVTDVKAIAKLHNATINDTTLSCVTGAIRKTLSLNGSVSDNLIIRAAIPVNMRSSTEDVQETCNKFSSFVINFPVGISNSVDRLLCIKHNMNEMKHSWAKYFLYYSLQMFSYLPEIILKPCTHFAGSRLTLAISNVNAGALSCSFAKHKMLEFHAFVPPPPNLNLGVLVLTIGDDLHWDISIDESVGVDPQEFARYVEEELAILEQANAK